MIEISYYSILTGMAIMSSALILAVVLSVRRRNL